MVIGFAVLSFVTVKTYSNAPPIPGRVTDEMDATIFTRDDIEAGQEVFLKYALMEHGLCGATAPISAPDYSAEYLHRLTEIMRDAIAGDRFGRAFAALEMGAAAENRGGFTQRTLKQNRFSRRERHAGSSHTGDRLLRDPEEGMGALLRR